jgi:hypothetical protein
MRALMTLRLVEELRLQLGLMARGQRTRRRLVLGRTLLLRPMKRLEKSLPERSMLRLMQRWRLSSRSQRHSKRLMIQKN